MCCECTQALWFAQNSLPLRWQIQHTFYQLEDWRSCDLLKIHYLCGDKDNHRVIPRRPRAVVICSKFITFAVTKTTHCSKLSFSKLLWFAKIHYLCGDKDNQNGFMFNCRYVVICSKFITFVVTKTTKSHHYEKGHELWFAQNSLPLWWQRQPISTRIWLLIGCDLLKIHYLCGDKDNFRW